ncbi:hypothetical protein MUK42_37737, partial [Musa troglodytarum]
MKFIEVYKSMRWRSMETKSIMAAVKAGCDAALMHVIGNLGLNQHETALVVGLKRSALQSGEILTWFSTNLRKATCTPTELCLFPPFHTLDYAEFEA